MAQIQTKSCSSFASDERGTVAVIFAICTFVLFTIVGLAIDVGRSYHASNKIVAAADAAVLAAAKSLRLNNLGDGAVADIARLYFNTDIAGSGGNYAIVNSLAVNIDRAKGSVGIDVTASVPTFFARIAGFDNFTLPRSSVAIFDAKDLEVGLQLDVTGSMGGSKIVELKTATKNLLDILMPDAPTGQKVRVALAPFSAGVNVGGFIKAVDGNRNAPNNCAYERLTATNEKTDASPLGQDAFKIRSDLTGAGVQDCPSAKIKPLSDDKAALKSEVDGYAAGGSTAGQLGASWAWNLISPNWSGIWGGASTPAAYNDGKTIKSVILMTDGAYNTVSGISNGSAFAPQAIKASQLSVDTCANMKAKGIIVYTVGFKLDQEPNITIRQRAIDTLTSCANEPAKFFRAENGAALDAAFRQIATDIVSLRISK